MVDAQAPTTSQPIAPAIGPQDLFAMMMGFKKTALLRTAIDLSLFDALAAGPATAADVAARLKTDPRATRFLLDALVTQGLIASAEDGYQLPPGVAELLVTSSPRYCGGISRVASSYGEWDVFGQLTETVRQGTRMADVDAHEKDFGYWVDFAVNSTFATAKGAALVAELAAPVLDSRTAIKVLDAGCGSGAFGFEIGARYPQAQVHAQDWPAVLEVAAGNAGRRGLGDRLTLLPGDIFDTELTGPYDVIIAANLLFLFSPERAAGLVKRLADQLADNGTLAMVSFMTESHPASAEHAHLLNLLMLSWTDGGEILTPRDYAAMAEAAGLSSTTLHTRPGLPLRVVLARRG